MARISKEEWVTTALDLLAQRGIAFVQVEPIAKSLKITKGSFYHHFKNRSDLHLQMLEYWENRQLAFLEELKLASYADPEEKLKALFLFILKKDVRHDIAVRHWSVSHEKARQSINRVDKERLKYCESIFEEMGYSGLDKIARAQFVYFSQVAEQHIFVKPYTYPPEELLEKRIELLK
jgi:AcrR family transcriptional regulator